MRIFAVLLALTFLCETRAASADITDGVNCGFTGDLNYRRNKPRAKGRTPAAIFRTADGQYYLIVPDLVLPKHNRFYFKDGDNELDFSAEVLLSNDPIFPLPHGPDYHIWNIPFHDLEPDLQAVIKRCAISEEHFVTPRLGMRVKVYSQSFDTKSVEPHTGIVAAREDKSYNRETIVPKPYHLVLPASAGAPSSSWVAVDEKIDGIEQPIAGLVIDHAHYKTGDCFIDIETLRWMLNSHISPDDMMAARSAPVKQSTCVFIRNLKNTAVFKENWRPTGLIADSIEEMHWNIAKARLRLKNHEVNFGVPGCLVKNGEATYLVVDSATKDLLKADSVMSMVVKGVSNEVRLGDNFKIDDKPSINLDNVFAAYRCEADAAAMLTLEAKAFALVPPSDEQETDFLFGRSIPNALLRGGPSMLSELSRVSVEEALVFMSIQNFDESNLSLPSLLDFNSGIYPAALSAASGHRERFYGLLGFNVQTQEPTIYTIDELLSFLPAK